MADAGVLSAINVCFKFVEFCMKVKDVSLENQVFVRIIARVRDDREETFRLMRKTAVRRHFEIDPDSRKYVEGTILALDKALQSIGRFVESVRLDEERNGSIGLVNRFEWVLRHQAKLSTRQTELDTCHKSLLQAMEMMRGFERDPLPPSYISATNPGDGNNEDDDHDILISPRRRLELHKESQKPKNLLDIDNTTNEEMDTNSLNLAMEELRVQDGFAPPSEERMQDIQISSRLTSPPSDTLEQMDSKEIRSESDSSNKKTTHNLSWEMSLPSTKSEWGSDTAARPGWENYEADLKTLEQSLTSSYVGRTSTDKMPPLQERNRTRIEEPVESNYPSSNSSNLPPTDTLRPCRSCCTLSSDRPYPLESSSSLRSITPTQSPTPSNVDPILLSSPHTLQNDPSVTQSNCRLSSPLDTTIHQSLVSSVCPGRRANTLPTPTIPIQSRSTTGTSLSSVLPETTSPQLITIAPPANTAGYYSPRHHPIPYQPYEILSGLIPVTESDSRQPFQGDRLVTTQYTAEYSLPEVVPSHLPSGPSKVGVVDTNSKFSIPRKHPNNSGTLAMGPSQYKEANLADNVRLRDVGEQLNEIRTNTMPCDERPELTSEESIRKSSTREEILKRKARQDLIWGMG